MNQTAAFRNALTVVDRSGIADDLEELIRPTKRGRKRGLRVRALLAAFVALASDGHRLHLTSVHKFLDGLSAKERTRAGVPQSLSYHQVAYLFDRMATAVDPSPYTAGHLTDEQRAANQDQLNAFMDRLLAATHPHRSEYDHKGSVAIDATHVASWARPTAKGHPNADPDASFLLIEQDGPKPKIADHCYALQASVWVGEQNDTTPAPALADRIRVTDGANGYGKLLAPVAIEMLAARKAAGQPMSDVLVDRGYSKARPQNFAYPAMRLGATPVFDLMDPQRKRRKLVEGAAVVNGWLYCPALPESLRDLTPQPKGASSKERTTFAQKVQARDRYAFVRETKPSSDDGAFRVRCPAEAGKVRCTNSPTSLSQPVSVPTLTPGQLNRCDPSSKACGQTTMTVHLDALGGLYQQHPWASDKWKRSYNRRNLVEGWFGNLKNEAGSGLRRGSFRVMGIAKVSMLLAVYAAATNLRLLDTWRAKKLTAKTAKTSGKRGPRGPYRKNRLTDLVATSPSNSPPTNG